MDGKIDLNTLPDMLFIMKFKLAVFFVIVLLLNVIHCDKHRQIFKQVEIRRDLYGIPHILAKTEEAAFFGAGYAQAENYIELISKLYLIANGRGAEYFGTDYIESDFNIIRFKTRAIVEEKYNSLRPEIIKIISAFARGINHFINKNRNKLPDWIQEVGPKDILT